MKQLEAKSVVLLRHHLKALRLPTIGAECEKVARRAASDNVDHLTYLLQVTELELLERERKAAERRLKAARLPTIKSLESFDFSARPSVNKVLVSELARAEFIDRRENVLFVGNPGTGKTHLAIALSAAACARGYRVRFHRVTELVTLLIEARDERALLGLRGRLAKLDLLVLDELGYVPASKVGAELLFDVISTAYERTSLMVASALARCRGGPSTSASVLAGDVIPKRKGERSWRTESCIFLPAARKTSMRRRSPPCTRVTGACLTARSFTQLAHRAGVGRSWRSTIPRRAGSGFVTAS